MKKALISALVLMAAVMTVTPVLAAPIASPSTAVRTGVEQTQPGTATSRSQNQRPVASIPPPIRQSQPLTQTTSLTETSRLTATLDLTATTGISSVLGVTSTDVISTDVTSTVEVTGTNVLTPTGGPQVDDPALDEAYSEILAGTIIANRSDVPIRFFIEGRTYEVAPLRSIGLALLRDTAILNLFNCEASRDDSDAGCFWDPYLLMSDGFYEVVIGQQLGQDILLSLRAAGAPPANQIWIQNRTGERETVIVNNELFEVAPAAVQEFSVITDAPVIVQLRSCIGADDRTICEWTPQGVEAGFYYGLVRSETPGPNNSRLTSLALQGVIASSGETVKAPPQAFCRLRVPTLNVRSGPGLEFPIIAKIRGTDTEPGSVVVVAFDATQTWMQVTERVARDGWVTSNPEFILCEGALAELPVTGQPLVAATPAPTEEPALAATPTEAVALAVAPTATPSPAEVETAPPASSVTEPDPVPVAPAPDDVESPEAETPEEQVTPTPAMADVPET
ncbi:MAG: hypothetical protein R6W76_07330 [Caldilinea sp.]